MPKYMFEHFSERFREQPRSAQEREERDSNFGTLSMHATYRSVKKKLTSSDPDYLQKSDDRMSVRRGYALIDEGGSQMEDLNIRLNYLLAGKVGDNAKIQSGKTVLSTLTKSGGAWAGATTGGAVGSLAGPAGTVLGAIGGGLAGGYFAKKTYKNLEREVPKKLGFPKSAKGIYPSTSAIDASIAGAYLQQNVDNRAAKDNLAKNSKKMLKQQKDPRGALKVLKFVPLVELVEIAYQQKKMKRGLTTEKIDKINSIMDAVEATLLKEYEHVQVSLARLTSESTGVKVSLSSAINEFLNLKLSDETEITKKGLQKKYAEALEHIEKNRALLKQLDRPINFQSGTQPTGWSSVSEDDYLKTLQKNAQNQPPFTPAPEEDIYEGESLGNLSLDEWTQR